MMVPRAVDLVAAKVGAGERDFGSSVDRVDGDYGQRLNGGGIPFPDQRGVRL